MTGCSTHPGTSYIVQIDPAFDSAAQETIIEAAEEWQYRSPPLAFHIVVENCNGTHNGYICLHPCDNARMFQLSKGRTDLLGITFTRYGLNDQGDTAGLFGIDSGEIWINMELLSEQVPTYVVPFPVKTTVLHELGHAMGEYHQNTITSIMYPTIGGAGDLQYEDLDQWYYLRGLQSPYGDYEDTSTCNNERYEL